ncbi:MAG: sigma-54 dependent transcriptional regulator [Bdellovibrionota bacterium]
MEPQVFTLLVVDDDPLIHQTLKMAVPKGWKVISVQDPLYIPWQHTFHAALIDMHLDGMPAAGSGLRGQSLSPAPSSVTGRKTTTGAGNNSNSNAGTDAGTGAGAGARADTSSVAGPVAVADAVADPYLPGGLNVIELLVRKNPFTEILAMSGDLTRDLMEKGLRAGAQKFLAKPLSKNEIGLHLEKIEALWSLRLASAAGKHNLVGKSSAMEKLRQEIARLKGERAAVLIEGETGAGKEVVARALHSQEDPRPWVAVNVAAIPENIFESEMFGHIKGAFTGAEQNKMGLLEASRGGDLFLDEMEAFPLGLQVKLLRFLESGELRKVGAKDSEIIETRVIVASNIPLLDLVKKGLFREDLYYRISEHKLSLPALRDRTEDIADLCEYFFTSDSSRSSKKLEPDGLKTLSEYAWPGNVRELKRVCSRLQLLSPLPVIRSEDVKEVLPKLSTTPKVLADVPLDLSEGLQKYMEKVEATVLQEELRQQPDIDALAVKLKVSRSNLYKKIKDYQLRED